MLTLKQKGISHQNCQIQIWLVETVHECAVCRWLEIISKWLEVQWF